MEKIMSNSYKENLKRSDNAIAAKLDKLKDKMKDKKRRSICYLREIDLLRFFEMVRIFFTNVNNRLNKLFLSARNWHEESPSFYERVNTHNYGTKILLINRLRNQ